MILPPTPAEIFELAEMARAFNAAPYSAIPARKPVTRRIRKRLSADAIDQLIERYVAGESIRALGLEVGIAPSSVSSLLRSRGVELRKHSIDPKAKQFIVDLRAQGYSLRCVAARGDCSYGTVRKILHDVHSDEQMC